MVPQLALPEGGEWIVILVIVVLLFGAKKLPELTRNAARAMNEFKKVQAGDDDESPAVEPTSTELGDRGAEGVREERGGL